MAAARLVAPGGLADEFLDARHRAGRGFDALRRRADQAHGELARIGGGQQFGAEADEQRRGARGEGNRDEDHSAGAAQQARHERFEPLAAAGGDCVRLGLAGADALVRRRQEPAPEGGDQEYGDAEGREERDHHREGDAVDQPGGEALHEEHGQKDDAGGQRACDDGARDLARAFRRGGHVVVAKAHAAVHGLDHDNGVVH